MELGGNITLVGFTDRDFAEIIVIKKIVGQYARRLHDTIEGFEHLTLSLKEVGDDKKYEMHARADVKGTSFASEIVDRNLFIALDSVLKKTIAQLDK